MAVIVNVKIKDTLTQMRLKMERALTLEVIAKTRRIRDTLAAIVKQLLINTIQNDSQWQELSNGALRGDLGFPRTVDLNRILEKLVNEVEVFIDSKQGTRVSAIKIIIRGVPSHFNDALALPEAEFVSSPSRSIIPWLRWLLFEGSNILIEDYIVERNMNARQLKISRTGLAVMEKKQGANFSIRPSAAGTVDNNIITRAIDRAKLDTKIINALNILYN